MELSSFFEQSVTDEGKYQWALHAGSMSTEQLEQCSLLVAGLILDYHLAHRPHLLKAWHDRCGGAGEHSEPIRSSLSAVVQIAVGLPSKPAPPDHLEGFVAEHLWFFLMKENSDSEPIQRIVGPDLDVSDKGGDGLVIHGGAEGAQPTLFRIWEIKKFTGSGGATRTASRASKQLRLNAVRYLTKYAKASEHLSDKQSADFLSRLPEEWILSSPKAAAGVCVGTSSKSVRKGMFKRMPKEFPLLLDPPRLRGVLVVLEDLPTFSIHVREQLWNGL